MYVHMHIVAQYFDFEKKVCKKTSFIVYYTYMLTPKKKQNIIKKAQMHDTDTGSSHVQTTIISERIEELANHLKKHPKDNHSRRGLIMLRFKTSQT